MYFIYLNQFNHYFFIFLWKHFFHLLYLELRFKSLEGYTLEYYCKHAGFYFQQAKKVDNESPYQLCYRVIPTYYRTCQG